MIVIKTPKEDTTLSDLTTLPPKEFVTRRQLLAAVSGGIAALSGCFSNDGNQKAEPGREIRESPTRTIKSEGTVEPSTSIETRTPNPEVREALDDVRGELDAAFGHMNSVGVVTDDGGFDPRGLPEFESDQLFPYVEAADTALETARSASGGGVAARQIRVLEGVTRVLDATIRLHVEIDTTLKRTAVYFKNTGSNYPIAVEAIGNARRSLDRWSDVNSDLQDGLQTVGTSPVAPGVTSFDYQRWRTLAQYAAGIPVSLSPALAGFERRGEAKVAQREGSRAWNDERWETAEEQYDGALEKLREAKGKFDQAIGADLVLYRTYVTTYICRDPGHRDAYLRFSEAALAKQHGQDEKGDRLHEEGRDLLAESISGCPIPE
jgi:hypothetical protein